MTVKLISERILGYSLDDQKTYTEYLFKNNDGDIKTLYTTDTAIVQGPLTDECPFVEKAVNVW